MIKKNKLFVALASIAIAALTVTVVAPAANANHTPNGCKTEPTNKHCDNGGGGGGGGGGDSTKYFVDPSGVSPLASFVTSDGGKRFGTKWTDFDIVTELVLWTLEQRPSSSLAVLADGNTAVTAFLPTDLAFKKLVRNLTGKNLKTERAVFNAVTGLGIDTVEAVLKYHVVVGGGLPASSVLGLNGGSLATLNGALINLTVDGTVVTLVDNNADLKDPKVVLKKIDLNSPNLQIAHGIDRVLMP